MRYRRMQREEVLERRVAELEERLRQSEVERETLRVRVEEERSRRRRRDAKTSLIIAHTSKGAFLGFCAGALAFAMFTSPWAMPIGLGLGTFCAMMWSLFEVIPPKR